VASESGKRISKKQSLNQSEKKKAVMSDERRTGERSSLTKQWARGKKSPPKSFKYFPHENCAASPRNKHIKSALQRAISPFRMPE
jgi:hypothetical protein